MGRLRILATEAEPFPEWWPRSAVEESFEVVTSVPTPSCCPCPRWRWRPEDFDVGWALARLGPGPDAVYNRFDSWDDPALGRGAATRPSPIWCRSTAGRPPWSPVPSCRWPMDRSRRWPCPTRRWWPGGPTRRGGDRAEIDVHFAGFYREPGWAGPARDTRDRHHRGHLLAQLASAIDPDRLLVRRAVYWESDQADQQAMRDPGPWPRWIARPSSSPRPGTATSPCATPTAGPGGGWCCPSR